MPVNLTAPDPADLHPVPGEIEQAQAALAQLEPELAHRALHLLHGGVAQKRHLKAQPFQGGGHVRGVVDGILQRGRGVGAVADDQRHLALALGGASRGGKEQQGQQERDEGQGPAHLVSSVCLLAYQIGQKRQGGRRLAPAAPCGRAMAVGCCRTASRAMPPEGLPSGKPGPLFALAVLGLPLGGLGLDLGPLPGWELLDQFLPLVLFPIIVR